MYYYRSKKYEGRVFFLNYKNGADVCVFLQLLNQNTKIKITFAKEII